MSRPEKNSYKESDTEKNSCGSKIPPPLPHNFSNGPSLRKEGRPLAPVQSSLDCISLNPAIPTHFIANFISENDGFFLLFNKLLINGTYFFITANSLAENKGCIIWISLIAKHRVLFSSKIPNPCLQISQFLVTGKACRDLTVKGFLHLENILLFCRIYCLA